MYNSQEKIFQTKEGVIHYEVLTPETDIESLQTVVLLHNFMSTGRSVWELFLPELTKRYRVLLIDSPGHGQSVGYPANFHHGRSAQSISKLLHHEDGSQGHLVGYSSGGMLIQLMLDLGLAEPTSITLISTTHSVNPATLGLEEPSAARNFQANDRWMEASAKLHDPYNYPGYFAQELVEGFRGLRADETLDIPLSTLRKWTMPACVIHGEKDADFSVQIAKNAAEALPNAQLHIIPEQRHSLIFRQPQIVEGILLKFLEEIL